MAPLFFVEDPVGICRSMDFRHHIKFTVNIVLCVTVIGIIDQYLAVCRNTSEYDEVSAAGEKSCPLRGDDRTAFGECLKYRIGIAGLCDAATAEMTGCSL